MGSLPVANFLQLFFVIPGFKAGLVALVAIQTRFFIDFFEIKLFAKLFVLHDVAFSIVAPGTMARFTLDAFQMLHRCVSEDGVALATTKVLFLLTC